MGEEGEGSMALVTRAGLVRAKVAVGSRYAFFGRWWAGLRTGRWARHDRALGPCSRAGRVGCGWFAGVGGVAVRGFVLAGR